MIWFKRIGLILIIICLGTVIDYIVHLLDVRFSVPFSYFTHKIFYGTLWGVVGYLIFRKYITSSYSLAFVISIVPAILLQVIYYLQGTLLTWVVLLFLVLHFFMFFVPGLYICKRYKHILLGS